MNKTKNICSVCFETKEIIPLKCQCLICHDCMCEWAIEYGKRFRRKSEEVKCPTDGCSEIYFYSELIKILDSRKQEILNDFLLKKYLQNTSDIKICPGQGCYNAQFSDSTNCNGEWFCQKCNAFWKTHEKEESNFVPIFQVPFIDRNELYSNILEEFSLNECPKCNIKIEKNGGCQFMLCQNCGHEFCWKCFQDAEGHKKRLCKLSWFTKFLIFLFMFVNLIMKFQFTYIIYRAYVAPAIKMIYHFLQIYFLKYMLVFNGFCFMSIGLLSAIISSMKTTTMGDILAMIAMAALELFYLFFICYFFSVYECLYAYLVQMFWFISLFSLFKFVKLMKEVWIDSVL